MENMLEYLDTVGQASLETLPLNEVDILCIAQMTYTVFDHMVMDNITLRDLSRTFFDNHSEEEIKKDKSFVHLAPLVLKHMASSPRFASARVKNYKIIRDLSTSEQFCALHLILPNGTVVVSYQGTDDSIVGWREDFNMTFRMVPSQRTAIEYLNKTCRDLSSFYVTGHSKGGNLALVAAMHCDELIQKKITFIYDMDGPGLSDEMFDQTLYGKIRDRFIKIVPEHDMIGMLFGHYDNLEVIQSSATGAFQHDAMTWVIQEGKFVPKELSQDSKNFKVAIDTWLAKINPNQREDFVNTLFDAVEKTGVKKLSHLETNVLQLMKVMDGLKNMDENSKTALTELIKVMKDFFLYSLRNKELKETE